MEKNNSRGYGALRSGAGLIERTDAGRLLLTGKDRRSYLQGLLTNDVAALAPNTGCYAAMLTAHGRMMTDMRVFELGDRVLLELPIAVTPSIRDHLDRFIFSEDVQVADVTATRAQFGVYGPRSAQVVSQVSSPDVVAIGSDPFGIDGFEVFVDASLAARVRDALVAAGAVTVEAGDLEAVRIESGRPLFGVDMDTDTIPLEAGIEDRAISRTKGCYVGQEVIVRVVDRGHGRVARRLVGLTFDSSASARARGATITTADREVGHVTSAVLSPSLRRPIALGYVHRDFTAAGTEVSVGGTRAVVSDLPFVLV